MNRFEYQTVEWAKRDDEAALVATLNELGHDGWEAVGLVPRSVGVPMPGMGADAVSQIFVLLKRPMIEE